MFRRTRRTMLDRITIPRRGHDMSVHLAIRDATTERKGRMATVVFAGLVGTIIEWYDFFIYGTAAALVFNTLFFPNIDPLAGTSCASVGFQLSAALGGGFSPIIATALAGYMGGTAGVSTMLILLAAITFITTRFATAT